MADFFAQVVAEFRALGMWCVIHGPEVWLGVVGLCWISTIGVVISSVIYFVKKDKSDPSNQNERKNK